VHLLFGAVLVGDPRLAEIVLRILFMESFP
jgi:hypothetical protein